MEVIRNKMRFVFVMLTCVICLNLISCSKDEPDNPGKNGFAPESLKIGWWVNYSGDYYENGTKYTLGYDGIKIISSTKIETSWNAPVATYKYTKTGKNTARLEIDTYTPIGTHDAVKIDDVLEMTFYSSTEFTFIGSRTKLSALTNFFCKMEGLGLISDKFIKVGFTNDSADDNEEDDGVFSVSAPIINNVQMHSAIVKGTIVGDVKFQERGVVYSTHSNPTISDNIVKSNADVINAELKDLFEGTNYYVRLYAKVNNKVTYGEEVSFKTLGVRTYDIELSQTNPYGSFVVGINAKLPNDVEKYGLCWNTSPNPKITDNYIEEEDRATSWEIENLQPATKYYMRAYHIDGSNIVYFENSEIEVFTMGGEYPTIDVEFVDGEDIDIINIDYENFPEGTYEVAVYTENLPLYDSGIPTRAKAYVEGVSGQLFFDEYYRYPSGTTTSSLISHTRSYLDIIVRFKNIDTGNKYYKSIIKPTGEEPFKENNLSSLNYYPFNVDEFMNW